LSADATPTETLHNAATIASSESGRRSWRARRPGAAAVFLVVTVWRRLLEPALGAVCLIEAARRAVALLGL